MTGKSAWLAAMQTITAISRGTSDDADHLEHVQRTIAQRDGRDAELERVAHAMGVDSDPFADKPTPEPGDSL